MKNLIYEWNGEEIYADTLIKYGNLIALLGEDVRDDI
jgi:hypothetical protein